MATFSIDHHHERLTDAMMNDQGRKNTPDFYYNLLCIKDGSRETIYKVHERFLTTFSPKLRRLALDEAAQTPPDQWSHPIALLIGDASKHVMELIVRLLAKGRVDVRAPEVAAFKSALDAFQIDAVEGDLINGSHDERREMVDIKDERISENNSTIKSYLTSNTAAVNHRSSPGVARVGNANLNGSARYPRSSSTPSTRLSSTLNGNHSRGPSPPRLSPQRPSIDDGLFTCQVNGCCAVFTAAPEALKHYCSVHGIRVYKNNGEFKNVKDR